MKRFFLISYIATTQIGRSNGQCNITCTSARGLTFLNQKKVFEEIVRMGKEQGFISKDIVITSIFEMSEDEYNIWIE